MPKYEHEYTNKKLLQSTRTSQVKKSCTSHMQSDVR